MSSRLNVGDLVELKEYGLGIVVDIVSFEQYHKNVPFPTAKHDEWHDFFPLVSVTVFEPIRFEDSDGDIKSQSTFVLDQKEIEEGGLEVINESR